MDQAVAAQDRVHRVVVMAEMGTQLLSEEQPQLGVETEVRGGQSPEEPEEPILQSEPSYIIYKAELAVRGRNRTLQRKYFQVDGAEPILWAEPEQDDLEETLSPTQELEDRERKPRAFLPAPEVQVEGLEDIWN